MNDAVGVIDYLKRVGAIRPYPFESEERNTLTGKKHNINAGKLKQQSEQ
jgi:hypothetical protein